MKALMLAAGVGERLFGDDGTQPPKSLIEFAGETLLARHIALLQELGVEELALVVGYRESDVLAEAEVASRRGFVTSLHNQQFREGSLVSMWKASPVLSSGADILFMDADVLYHTDLVRRLIASPYENCFLLDRNGGEGDEPVRLCLTDGVPVDFGKGIEGDFDEVGEWPGFMRLSPAIAARLAEACEKHVAAGRTGAPYEDAVRDVLLSEASGTFGVEDITGLPWIEIDFPDDLARAETVVLPKIRKMEGSGT